MEDTQVGNHQALCSVHNIEPSEFEKNKKKCLIST